VEPAARSSNKSVLSKVKGVPERERNGSEKSNSCRRKEGLSWEAKHGKWEESACSTELVGRTQRRANKPKRSWETAERVRDRSIKTGGQGGKGVGDRLKDLKGPEPTNHPELLFDDALRRLPPLLKR